MTEIPTQPPPSQESDPQFWYSTNRELYAAFTQLLHATVENLIRAEKIEFLAVTSRTKSAGSFVEKISRKGYKSAKEITDVCGVRVITFIETDALAVANLVRKSFTIHPEKSLDKSEELGDSQVGYRSIHLICELGRDRSVLPEYKRFKGLLFEIQVRTILQHAWAEIEHDRGYKFSGVLPPELRRRLNLLAGQLELTDREFTRLAKDVDLYSAELEKKSASGDFDIELSSESIKNFIQSISSRISSSIARSEPSQFALVIDELSLFGVKNIADLQNLFSEDFVKAFNQVGGATTEVGILRRAMMYA